jgi:hypothetical protein
MMCKTFHLPGEVCGREVRIASQVKGKTFNTESTEGTEKTRGRNCKPRCFSSSLRPCV